MPSRHASSIKQAVSLFQKAVDTANNDDDRNETHPRKVSVRSMERITEILCEAYANGLSEADLSALIERACDAEDKILDWACGSEYEGQGGFDHFPLYSGNVVEDLSVDGRFESPAKANALWKLLAWNFLKDAPAHEVEEARQRFIPNPTKPYDSTLAPGKQSSPLARFKAKPQRLPRRNLSTLALREARCEIQSRDTCNPWQMAIGKDVIVVQGVSGYKERDPNLDLYKLGMTRDEWGQYGVSNVEQGHLDIATRLVIDGSRSLVWTADDSRIKSTKYSFDGLELETDAEHTFDSAKYEGPIALLDNGARLIRAGKSGLAIWDVDSAATHATSTSGFVDKKLSRSVFEDTLRDLDGTSIERSRGSKPTTTTANFDQAVKQRGGISLWASHPSNQDQTMLCTSGMDNFGMFALDLETGKRTSRYFGHGAHVSGFSTTPADANLFLTSCDDGGSRLYDVRCAVPSLTLSSGREQVNSSVLFVSGGGFYAFVGGEKSEQIKLWDIRGKSALYELATGNNQVTSLAWDETNTTLYASTECGAIDRMGYRHGYRRAKIKTSGPSDEVDEDEHMDSEDSEDSEDEGDYIGKGWPRNANHNEDSFGVAFDAGGHRLFRYVFKADADVTVLPEYRD